ncbi:hypothetical protein Tco_0167405 [Tanacetum coccineum]
MGEVIIKPVFQAYLIPGVYFAPEVSLNILSIDLLNQQGFEVVSDGDRYRLEYMFRESTGNMLDLNKLRNMQNTSIEDYFEGLNKNRFEKKDEMARFVEDVNPTEVHPFQEFVGSLDKQKNDGDDVKKVYMVYLDVFVSYYKTARAPQAPAEAVEDSSLESFQWSVGKEWCSINSQKGEGKIEHSASKLENRLSKQAKQSDVLQVLQRFIIIKAHRKFKQDQFK